MGLFDEFINKEQTPEELAELEKWHESAKKKSAAAIEAREKRYEDAEKEFENLVNRKPKHEEDDEIVGELTPVTIKKTDETTESDRIIEIVPDHFSPNAVRRDFAPRDTVRPPPMRQIVDEVHPEIRRIAPVAPVVPVVTDTSLAALTTAVDNLSRRLDVIETNQAQIANRTLNAICNSLNEMLALVRKELSDASPRLVESVSRSFEPALRPVLELLEGLKSKEPEPATQESARDPEPEQKQETPRFSCFGEMVFDVWKGLVSYEGTPGPIDYTTMELSHGHILERCECDGTRALEMLIDASKRYLGYCIELDQPRTPASFYKWLKELDLDRH